jgi:hypothetical protein
MGKTYASSIKSLCCQGDTFSLIGGQKLFGPMSRLCAEQAARVFISCLINPSGFPNKLFHRAVTRLLVSLTGGQEPHITSQTRPPDFLAKAITSAGFAKP